MMINKVWILVTVTLIIMTLFASFPRWSEYPDRLSKLLNNNITPQPYKDCRNISTNLHTEDGHYRSILPQQGLAYACCAYYTQDKHLVEIVTGFVKRQQKDILAKDYKCLLQYGNKSEHETTPLTILFANLKGIGIFKCNLSDSRIPSNVAIINAKGKSKSAYNTLQITTPPSHSNKKGKLAACIKALFGYSSSNNMSKIIEFIEFHRIIGVEHFYFYIRDLPQWILYALKQYQNEGIVTLLVQDLPPEIEQRSNDAYLSYNDCLRRTRSLYLYVAVMDINEFFIPRQKTLMEVIQMYFDNQRVGSMIFSSLYFILSLPNDEDYTQPPLSFQSGTSITLYTQIKTMRAERILRNGINKSILRPTHVDLMDAHKALVFTEHSYYMKSVNYEDGLVHHYRQAKGVIGHNWGWTNDGTYSKVIDRTAQKYSDQLVQNMNTTLHRFGL